MAPSESETGAVRVAPYLAATLLQLDLDQKDKAHEGHHHKKRQKNPHVKVFGGLL